MKKIVAKVKKYCNSHDLLHAGDRVLLAVSGGPDSTALLHIMHFMRKEYDLHIEVAHLEHGLRGEASKDDQRFVAELCKRRGVRFHTKCVDVLHARNKSESVEEAARRFRMEYFYDLIRRFGFESIATGHTVDDNIETIIFRLLSGTGSSGIQGIQPRSGRIIHPLLSCAKTELQLFLEKEKQGFRIDHTNYCVSYRRNKIREEIVPRFHEVNNRYRDHILNLARIIHEEDQLMNAEAEKIFYDLQKHDNGISAGFRRKGRESASICIDVRGYTRLSEAMKRRVILFAVDTLCGDDLFPKKRYIPFVVLDELVKQPLKKNKILYHNELFRIRKEYETIVFEKKVVYTFNKKYLYRVDHFDSPVIIEEIEREIRFELKTSVSSFEKNIVYLDFDKLVLPIHIRNRAQGDRISLPNVGMKKLKTLFIDEKVPSVMRDQVPIIVSDEEIAGVFSCFYGKLNRVSVSHCVSGETKKVLACELSKP
jgi:tRNA(Ile)-lysidine synthase